MKLAHGPERIAGEDRTRVRTMKKLLVLTSTYPRWKSDYLPTFVHELSKGLSSYFQVAVLCPHSPGAATEEIMDGVKIFRYRYAPTRIETLVSDGGISSNLREKPLKMLLLPAFLLMQVMALRRLARKFAPDLVHAHWLIPQGFSAAILRSLMKDFPPFLVTVHGSDLSGYRNAPLKLVKKLVVKRASSVTVVNGSMVERIRKLGCECPISVRPMGTDLEKLFTFCGNSEREEKTLLYVGRLIRSKGILTLLSAFRSVLEVFPDAVLRIAGNGPESETVRSEISRQGMEENLKLLGPVNHVDLPELYRQASVFVAPFDSEEGFGLVVVEAIGCGCKVVATDTPAVRDISSGISTVTMVPASDPAILAMAITKVLGDSSPTEANLLTSIRTVRERFDWSVVAEGYAKVLERLSFPGNCDKENSDV